MIYGIGIDIIEVKRVQKSIETIDGFKEKIFTPIEIVYCESKKWKFEHYAARFAAKEAFFKAIGTGWRNGLAFKEVEVVNNELGKPDIILHGKAFEFSEKENLSLIHISLSHIKETATAYLIIEN